MIVKRLKSYKTLQLLQLYSVIINGSTKNKKNNIVQSMVSQIEKSNISNKVETFQFNDKCIGHNNNSMWSSSADDKKFNRRAQTKINNVSDKKDNIQFNEAHMKDNNIQFDKTQFGIQDQHIYLNKDSLNIKNKNLHSNKNCIDDHNNQLTKDVIQTEQSNKCIVAGYSKVVHKNKNNDRYYNHNIQDNNEQSVKHKNSVKLNVVNPNNHNNYMQIIETNVYENFPNSVILDIERSLSLLVNKYNNDFSYKLNNLLAKLNNKSIDSCAICVEEITKYMSAYDIKRFGILEIDNFVDQLINKCNISDIVNNIENIELFISKSTNTIDNIHQELNDLSRKFDLCIENTTPISSSLKVDHSNIKNEDIKKDSILKSIKLFNNLLENKNQDLEVMVGDFKICLANIKQFKNDIIQMIKYLLELKKPYSEDFGKEINDIIMLAFEELCSFKSISNIFYSVGNISIINNIPRLYNKYIYTATTMVSTIKSRPESLYDKYMSKRALMSELSNFSLSIAHTPKYNIGSIGSNNSSGYKTMGSNDSYKVVNPDVDCKISDLSAQKHNFDNIYDQNNEIIGKVDDNREFQEPLLKFNYHTSLNPKRNKFVNNTQIKKKTKDITKNKQKTKDKNETNNKNMKLFTLPQKSSESKKGLVKSFQVFITDSIQRKKSKKPTFISRLESFNNDTAKIIDKSVKNKSHHKIISLCNSNNSNILKI